MSGRCKEEYTLVTHLSAPIFCPKEKVVFSEQDWSFLRTKLSFPSDKIMGLLKWKRMAR